MKTPAAALAAALWTLALPARADVVIDWNNALLDAVRADQTAPPRASRAMTIVHAAVHDAVNAINPTHEPYSFRGSPADAGASQPAAAASAAHKLLTSLYPAQTAAFDSRLAVSLAAVPDGEAKTRGR